MPSPFPGMDPYLEDPAFWEGFHVLFIAECTFYLSDRLPKGYVANAGERIRLISRSDAAAEEYVPDVSVAKARRRPRRRPGAARGGGAVAVAVEPVTIPSIDALEVRDAFIEIRRLPAYEIVTSIELLSPANKFGEGVGEYRAKRRALVGQGVHVVEIDLLRRGARTELAEPLPPGAYFAMCFRADRRPDVDVYAWPLRGPLTPVAVPLKRPDRDVQLDLAAVVTSIYDRGHFAEKLRYRLPPPGPMSAADVRWASALGRSVRS